MLYFLDFHLHKSDIFKSPEVECRMAAQLNTTTIQDIDKALQRYYKALGHEYDSIFKDFCDDNEIDLDEEFKTGAQESLLVDFDEDFPFPPNQTPKQEEARKEWIFDLLRKIRKDPNIEFNYSTTKLAKGLYYVLIYKNTHQYTETIKYSYFVKNYLLV